MKVIVKFVFWMNERISSMEHTLHRMSVHRARRRTSSRYRNQSGITSKLLAAASCTRRSLRLCLSISLYLHDFQLPLLYPLPYNYPDHTIRAHITRIIICEIANSRLVHFPAEWKLKNGTSKRKKQGTLGYFFEEQRKIPGEYSGS